MTKKQYREDNKKEINERVRQKRIINNIEIKKRDREYYKKNRDKRLQDRKRYYLSHKDDILKKSICHNKEKGYNALHAKTYREIKKRGISFKKCMSCSCGGKIIAHHPDYNKRNEVVFVCVSCHSQIHNGIIQSPKPIDILSFKIKSNAVNKNRVTRWSQIGNLG